MREKLKIWIVVLLLTSAGILSFAFPQHKYEGTGFIANIKTPLAFGEWRGVDVSKELNVNLGEDIFNFISDILAYQYVNNEGKKLLFIILDAGNFHNPKVCFTSAGYEIRELDDIELNIAGHYLKSHALFTKKGHEEFLSFYWIVIDKNVAHGWIEQKVKQLYFSLFNKKRVGLMVRIDIPATKNNINDAQIIAEDFIGNLVKRLSRDDVAYILGIYPILNEK